MHLATVAATQNAHICCQEGLPVPGHVSAWLQRQVDQLGCSSFEEFKRAVDSDLAAVPKEHLVNLVGSMKKRIELVVQNEGGPTGY